MQFRPSPYFFLGDTLFGEVLCKDIWIRNLTNDTIVISNLFFNQNIHFSIPNGQLPLIIAGQDSACLEICFSAIEPKSGFFLDTLIFFQSCYFAQLRVSALLDTNYFSARSNCNVEVNGKSAFIGTRQIVSVATSVPEQIIIQFDNKPFGSIAKIELYNIFGRKVEYFETTEDFVQINTLSLSRGIYLLKISILGNYYNFEVIVR